MLTRYKLNFLLRIFSLVMLSIIPSLYLFEILPSFVLPVWAVIVIYLCYQLQKKRIKISASIILLLLSISIFFIFILFLLKIISAEPFDILYLRLGVILPFLIIQSFFISVSTILFCQKEKYRRYEPIILFSVFALFFFGQGNFSMSVFDHPIYAVLFSLSFSAIEMIRIFLSFNFEKKQFAFFLLFLPFFAFIMTFVLKNYNESASVNHGGLLQPTLFRFDFSDYLKLQSEIKMSGDLILVAHFDNDFSHNMLRRMYLSGWDSAKGFYEKKAPSEKAQITSLPKGQKDILHRAFSMREKVAQEYFFVNLSPSSFIAMDYPTQVIPYEIWDSSKFNGGYKVFSDAIFDFASDLYGEAFPSGDEDEGMSKEDLDFYTKIDEESFKLVHQTAEEITGDIPDYLDKVLALQFYFTDGDFRYSLKPGKAHDGNQLKYFLTETKKGYCTYFAFSYALMLRSIGIPARVAVGFFVQPESEVMNYYPVRANMAHAWVEVFFPFIGWVSFDPTTSQLAEGENINFGMNAGGEEFNSLLSEILEKRSEIKITEITEKEDDISNISTYIKQFFKENISLFRFIIIIFLIMILAAYKARPHLVLKFSGNNRRVVLTAGKLFKKKTRSDEDTKEMNALIQKAKFAPECTIEDANTAKNILKNKTKKIILLLAFCLVSCFVVAENAETIVIEAEKAVEAENWERALSLLQDGIKKYPQNDSLFLKLGEIYHNKELYNPAYKALKKGLEINPENSSILFYLSSCASLLNKYEEALIYIKNYLRLIPYDRFAASNYGWLCYKCHRPEEGINFLLDNIKRYGEDLSVYNSLGTLYNEMFDYEKSKEFYTKAIRGAEQGSRTYSGSVYYYNKAILESQFYRFDNAIEDAKAALNMEERTSGYMMLGELEERRNNFSQALSAYLSAYADDETPLSALSIINLFLKTGHIEKAEQYILNELQNISEAWISNYGLSVNEFKSNLYDIKKSLYIRKYNFEKTRLTLGFLDWIKNFNNKINYKLKYTYYDAVFRLYSLKVAKEYKKNNTGDLISNTNTLYTNTYYYHAFKGKGKKALKYLRKAESIETMFIPQSAGIYLADRGILEEDLKLLNEGISKMDSEWEKHSLADLYAQGSKIAKKNSSQLYYLYLESLFDLNPAGFLEYDIKLPVKITADIDKTENTKITAKKMKKLILSSRFMEDGDSKFSLRLTYSGKTLFFKLADKNGYTLYSKNFTIENLDKTNFKNCVNIFVKDIFTFNL
ncbi:transglutaminase [Treponema sp. OMZ 792]|uniref:transglutaminase domain-containing protein n=1 Tax=unclassified Treponema TaxID=2638727 RepID=UPI0020A4FC99|nr:MULTISPECIES: transglutaminase domain-containing protein [unclassified Treponema]UTC74688.1 transglutaminase [Treponema sp. OMZ 792]UTC76991.1 transglutaminase [Treponema sp. OMZ 799]UTC81082.1 transglutaminase [Treponema sp. OMZ 798]